MLAPIILLAVYVVGWSKLGPKQRRGSTLAAAVAAALILGVTLSPPIENLADRSFTGHMVQHLLLVFVVAVLAVLARPLTTAYLATGLAPHPGRKPVWIVGAAFSVLLATMVISHVPAVYDLTVSSDPVHAFSHLAYLAAGFFYWSAVLAVDRSAVPTAHGPRLIALVALPPLMALLAVTIGSADHRLYELATSVSDQQAGAALMWIAPMGVWLPVLGWLVLDWANREQAATERRERAQDHLVG